HQRARTTSTRCPYTTLFRSTLKKQRRELSEKKKALYAEYRKAQSDMRQAVAVKANIEHLLGHKDEEKNKAQERWLRAADNRRWRRDFWTLCPDVQVVLGRAHTAFPRDSALH